jgi:REP element-mobilizing transposase RayT
MARRARTRPVQTELRLRTWGGRRKGAGRKPSGPRRRVPHVRRPAPKREHPQHVTIRFVDGVPSLRSAEAFACILAVFRAARGRFGMHIVEFSVLSNHIHLLVECERHHSLERGMRGLNTRLAKRLNRLFQRKGKLVAHRYHARALSTPQETRNALRYVLLNQRIHAERNGRRPPPDWIDSRSSGPLFPGWRRAPHDGGRLLDLGTSSPRTWLLRTGWLVHGRLAFDESTPTGPPRSRASAAHSGVGAQAGRT